MNLFVNILLWIAYITSLYFSIFLLLVYFDKKNIFKTEHSSLNPKAEPLVSILVPAYNEENTILKTLISIQELDYPKTKLEVIVIDDGSKDNTKQIVQEYIKDKPYFSLISHPNMGKAASMNKTLKMIKGEFFACLDADSFVHHLTLKKMLSQYYQKNYPNLAIITPAMKVYQPKNILQKIQWLEYLVIILIARVSSHLDSLYVAPGPFSLYRTEIIRRLGGFDEESIVEDQEIAYKVQKNNYRVTQCFDGYVYTVAPKQFKPFYRQRKRWYLGSIICLKKYKQMIANRKYGDFGMMQMTKNVLGYFFAITGITIAIYFLLKPLLEQLKSLIIIKFNIFPYLANLNLKVNFLDLLLTDFRKGFIVLFLFIIGAMFFYYAHRNANEKMTKFGWLHLLPYFVFYYLMKGSILLLSLVHFARNKKLKW